MAVSVYAFLNGAGSQPNATGSLKQEITQNGVDISVGIIVFVSRCQTAGALVFHYNPLRR